MTFEEQQELRKRELIDSILVLPSNFYYIGDTRKINGTLLTEIKRIMELYCLEEKKRVWKEACESQLALIAKTFRENKHKGSFNDQPVFQAIAETIKNHPLAEFKP